MAPYYLLIGLPALAALAGARRAGLLFLLVGLFYWLVIGFRYQVGMDWGNYISLLHYGYVRSNVPLSEVVTRSEPAFAVLSWFAAKVWGGIIFINAVSAAIFCFGLFLFAKRCAEPFLAIVVATPLLVIAFAMSGVRQAIAIGIVFAMFATWERRSALMRVGFVLLASLFHFSAIFVLLFVALAARVQPITKLAALSAVFLIMALAIYIEPTAVGAYSELYVSGRRKLEAPGAIAHFAVISTAAIVFLRTRRRWPGEGAYDPLLGHLAATALLCVPFVAVSSVGAYRFALYLWPVGMYVWSGVPQTLLSPKIRHLYRYVCVVASVTLVWGWLTFANNAEAWRPYKNWLLQPEDVALTPR